MQRLLLRSLRRPLVAERFAHSKHPAKKTCLYQFHEENGAKFVDFAGYSMPVQYADQSIQHSTMHTRHHVSVFDVSHMLQTEIHGKDAIAFIESLTPADVENLKPNHGCLTIFTNENGGIKDDLVVNKTPDGYLYVVSNAGCAEKDLNHLQTNAAEWRQKGKDVEVRVIDNDGLVAVQGPEAKLLIEPEVDFDISKLYFMQSTSAKVFGIPNCRLTRCGYTGEDGFEIRFPAAAGSDLVSRMLNSNRVTTRMAGLGARDVLRLEAGLCLYGHDINENTTPTEAALNFVVAKRRRETLGFPGAERICREIAEKKVPKKRVGFVSQEGRCPREHLPLTDPLDKACIGFVTSGCPSPTLGHNIAMGYVDAADAVVGKTLHVDFGSKQVPVTVAKLPFHPTNYYTKPKAK